MYSHTTAHRKLERWTESEIIKRQIERFLDMKDNFKVQKWDLWSRKKSNLSEQV